MIQGTPLPLYATSLSHLLLVLTAKMQSQLKSDSPRDPDGLYIIDEDNFIVKLFTTVIDFHKLSDWANVPLLVEYMETMIR